MNNLDKLKALFANAPDVFVYHIDDVAEDVLDGSLDDWREFVSSWSNQSSDWKSNVKLILDKIDAPRLIILLEVLIYSHCREDVTTSINVLSLMDASQLPPAFRESVVQFLKDSWTTYPEWRRQLEVSAKASHLEVNW